MIGMPDREKVSGFELCANGKPCIGEKFTQCPFSPRNNDEQNCGVTMARFALALLKEQEAKTKHCNDIALEYAKEVFRLQTLLKEQEAKPVIVTTNAYGTRFYHCPRCNRDLYIYPRQLYCRNCGQAVKWDE